MAEKNKTEKSVKQPKQPKTSNIKKITDKVKTKARNLMSKNKPQPKNKQQPNTVKSNRLEMLVTIVARNKAEFYLDLLQSFDINMQIVCLAKGTANENMLGLLGLTDSEKAVIFSVIQENKVRDALNTLEEKFTKIKNGKGIAYTIPLSSVIGTLIYGFLSNNTAAVKENNQNG